MPQRIDVPGMGVVEFPDGMSDDQIVAAIKANAPQQGAPSSPAGTGTENFAAGFGRGLYNLARGGKQRLDEAAASLESLVPGGADISRKFGGKTAADIQAEGQAEIDERRRMDKPLLDTWQGTTGDILGTVAGGSMFSRAGPIGSGAALGFLTPTATGESPLKNTAMSAGLSFLGDKAIRGISRMVSPKIAPDVKALSDQGVKMTPGQIIGGAANKAEERATSLPFVGDAIASARRRSVDSFDRVAINRALTPIGDKLPEKLAGREAIQYADDALGKAYDDILPKLTTQADAKFVSDIQALRSLVTGGNMGPAEGQQFNRILQNQVLGKFQGQAAITGETLKQMESELGRVGRSYMSDASADKRQLGGAVLELQSSLRDLVMRSNPKYADELKAINTGFANFKRVQRAAASVGAEEGVFSPAHLQNAVKALDRSKDKGRFAKGQALMQDLSDPGKSILGSKVPDSGTPGRLMNVGAMASAAFEPTIAAGLLGSTALYSEPALMLTRRALLNRAPWAQGAASRIEDLAPLGGLFGAALPQLGQ